jgi:hypothetical protein
MIQEPEGCENTFKSNCNWFKQMFKLYIVCFMLSQFGLSVVIMLLLNNNNEIMLLTIKLSILETIFSGMNVSITFRDIFIKTILYQVCLDNFIYNPK